MTFEGIRRVTDPLALRAMSHPVRLALMEALRAEGALTATQAAELLGESPANCSFHLRTLAKYGFVAEAEGGRGRQRPWRLVDVAHTIPDPGELPGDAGIAAGALVNVLAERDAQQTRRWLATATQYPKAWREASFYDSITLQLTPPELRRLGESIEALLAHYVKRTPEDRPPGAAPVRVAAVGFPTRMAASERTEDQEHTRRDHAAHAPKHRSRNG
jgi:DNA-binding transcriptional ArsR family regulator